MNWRAQGPIPAATAATVDTVELFVRWPSEGLRARIEAATSRRAHVEDCRDRTGHWRGVRAIFNRPTPAAVALIEGMLRNERLGATISRVDIALDLRMNCGDDADAIAVWLDRHIILKWRSARSAKRRIGETIYWSDKRRSRNLVVYRKMKMASTVRIELRFLNSRAVGRAGLDTAEKLKVASPIELMEHNMKAGRFTERFKIKIVRKAVANDRKQAALIEIPRSKRTQQFIDRYRAAIPRRIRGVLERIEAQHIGRHGFENVSLAFLRIPDHVTWPALKSQENSGEGAMVDGYYGGEQ